MTLQYASKERALDKYQRQFLKELGFGLSGLSLFILAREDAQAAFDKKQNEIKENIPHEIVRERGI